MISDVSLTKYLVVGENGTLIQSTDGLSWSSINTGLSSSIKSIFSQTATNLVVCGANGLIAKSTTSGTNFVQQNSGVTGTLNSSAFYGSNIGIAVGSGGTVIQTTNGGTNWINANSGVTDNLNFICFSTNANFQSLIVGDNGTVLKAKLTAPSLTFTLTPIPTGTSLSLKYAYMTDSANIWIAASSGKILRTTNGGTTWLTINTGFTNDLYSISFQSSEIYACGSGGLVIKSTDNGATFSTWNTGTTNDLKSIIVKNKIAITTGNSGTALRGLLGGTGGTFAKQQNSLNSSNAATWIWNTGVFNQDLRTNNTPGYEWPRGTGKFAQFTSGLCLAGNVNGELRMANASYSGEYIGGYIENGIAKTNSNFQVFKVKQGDNCNNSIDYANWQAMIPYGAPYKDVNGNGQYDACIDVPGIKNSFQTFFVCLTDGFSQTHTISEGFSGGTAPMNAEVHLTAWSYLDSNSMNFINDVLFFKWDILNKNNSPWTGFYSSIVCDPDLGDASDDYIGCDSVRNLGYCYNSSNNDGIGSGRTYGANPPATGMRVLKTPVRKNSVPADTVPMTSFVYFTGTGAPGPSCEQDPSSAPSLSYNYMKGVKKDGTPWLNPTTTPPYQTKFCYKGDPETASGWTEYTGRIENCGGITTGNIVPSPPGDRRYIMSMGRDNFTFNPGDTQTIVMAQLIARGTNNKNAVTKLKQLSDNVYNLYKSGAISIGIVNNLSEVATEYVLYQNYPNPFNPSTNIKFSIPQNSFVSLKIYDVSGKVVDELLNQNMTAGVYEYLWNASALPSGIYFYRLETEGFTETKKMVLVK
jgi:photosystem II stability/assembly factor-like uncharacterized protein